jgi:hypothetical protein
VRASEARALGVGLVRACTWSRNASELPPRFLRAAQSGVCGCSRIELLQIAAGPIFLSVGHFLGLGKLWKPWNLLGKFVGVFVLSDRVSYAGVDG